MSEQPSPRRIELTLDDLHTPEVDARIEEMLAAGQPNVVQSVGSPLAPAANMTRTSGGFLRGNTVSLALAGLVGGIAGWGIGEVLAEPLMRDRETYFTIALWTAGVALGVGAVLAMWEGIQARSREKAIAAARRALPIALLGGFVGGLVGKWMYMTIVEDAIQAALRKALLEDQSIEEVIAGLKTSVHFARAVGFGLFGACVGVALGLSSKARQRAINGAIGGTAGGVLGGFLFDYIDLGSSVASRFVALSVMGAAIGAAIGLVEAARKEFWLEIVSGGMAGKQFIIYHESTSIGSGPDCHITLIKDPSISPMHMWLTRSASGVTVRAASHEQVVVNGISQLEASLKDGDLIQVGQTLLRFGEKEPTVVMPGPLRS